MDVLECDLDRLKLSAFSKLHRLGDIRNVTIGPNSVHSQKFDKKTTSQVLLKSDVKTERRYPALNKRSHGSEQHLERTSENEVNLTKVYLEEIETKRKQNVEKAVQERFNQFEEFARVQHRNNQHQWLEQQQAFISSVQQQEHNIMQAVQQTDVNSVHRNEKLVQRYQKLYLRKAKIEQQIEQNRERQRILNENVDKIRACQSEILSIYEEIPKLIATCTNNERLKKNLDGIYSLIHGLPLNIDEVIAKAKNLVIGDKEVQMAVESVSKIKWVRDEIERNVKMINSQCQQQVVPQLPERPQVIISNTNKTTVRPVEQSTLLDRFVNLSNYKQLSEIIKFHWQYTETFNELLADEKMKQFKFDCIKAVNNPVNALSAINSNHLKDKYVKLHNLLSGKTVLIGECPVNASKHPQGIAYCTNLLAKKFVLQGDSMISSKPEAAFCYATIIVTLWNDFPNLGKLLLHYFYKQCPYLVPFYIPKIENQTEEEYYTNLGYHYNNGKIEKQDKFLKRMTGIMSLYFAILIAKPKQGSGQNPHNIKVAWKWLSSILKLEPHLDITATALHTFLETIGFEMEVKYGLVFRKLMTVISTKFLPAVKAIDSGGPVSRLELLLEEYNQNGFKKSGGVLPDNFW